MICDFFGRLGIYSRTGEGPLFCGVPVASRNTNEHHDGIAVGRWTAIIVAFHNQTRYVSNVWKFNRSASYWYSSRC